MWNSFETTVQTVWKAPLHTGGERVIVPVGTVLIANDQVPGATAFGCYPENYDEMELVLVSEKDRTHDLYFAYGLGMPVEEVGWRLKSLSPLQPRPAENRLPRTQPRPEQQG